MINDGIWIASVATRAEQLLKGTLICFSLETAHLYAKIARTIAMLAETRLWI
jgi:hypothetical protein